MESADTDNSRRGSRRVSSDRQFWLRIACVLPFSIIAWGAVVWWALQEVPIYAAQLVDTISNWTSAQTDSAPAEHNAVKESAIPRVPEPTAYNALVEHSADAGQWQWRALTQTARFDNLHLFDASDQQTFAGEHKSRQNGTVDPFGAAKFLDFLRRSTNSSGIAFIYPRSRFPISLHATNGSRHGSGLPSTMPHRFAASVPLIAEHRGSSAPAPVMQAALPNDLEPEIGERVQE